MKNRGQEEIAGFGVIIVIVAIIFLVFLVSYVNKPSSTGVESYEVNSFVQAALQYTTTCEKETGNLTLQRLIFECEKETNCFYNIKACKALNDSLKGIIKESWNVGANNSVKGYNLTIISNGKETLRLQEGVVTNNYRGSEQDFGKEQEFIQIFFNIYN